MSDMPSSRSALMAEAKRNMNPGNIEAASAVLDNPSSRCMDRINVLARLFTSLPPVDGIKEGDVLNYFALMRIVFHPDRHNSVESHRAFATKASQVINHCSDTSRKWLGVRSSTKSKGDPRDLKGGPARTAPARDGGKWVKAKGPLFGQDRARYEVFLNIVAEARRNKKRKMIAGPKGAGKKRAEYLLNWWKALRQRYNEIARNFERRKLPGGRYVYQPRTTRTVKRGPSGKQVIDVPASTVQRFNEIKIRDADYKTFVDFLVAALPKTKRYEGVVAALTEFRDGIAELVRDSGMRLDIDKGDVELTAVELVNELVHSNLGGKKSQFVDDSAKVKKRKMIAGPAGGPRKLLKR